MQGNKKKTATQEKHPGRVAQGHKLAALMKKRKEEILCNKEQSSVHPSVQSKVQTSVQPTVQPTTGITFALKVVNVKPPKASLDAMDIIKLGGGICGGVFVKNLAVYKK